MVKVNLLAPAIQVTLEHPAWDRRVYLPVWAFVAYDGQPADEGRALKFLAVEVRTETEGGQRDRARKVGEWR